jgi:hypothetical protein
MLTWQWRGDAFPEKGEVVVKETQTLQETQSEWYQENCQQLSELSCQPFSTDDVKSVVL